MMNERVRLINDYRSGEFGIAELARQYCVSRKTVYKWIERYEEESPCSQISNQSNSSQIFGLEMTRVVGGRATKRYTHQRHD